MEKQDALVSAENNETELFAQLASLPEAKVDRSPDCVRLFTGQNFWLFNGIFRARLQDRDPARRVEEWIDYYSAAKVPFGIFLHPAFEPKNLSSIVNKLGFTLVVESTAVIFDSDRLRTLSAPPLSSDFRVESVDTTEKCAVFFDCFSAAFGVPRELSKFWVRWICSCGFVPQRPFQSINIIHQNKSVAVASYFIHDGIAGIYNIGVLPEYRGLGLGTQISKAIAELAVKRGIRYLSGSGSQNGMRVYRKANVQELGKVQRWIYSINK